MTMTKGIAMKRICLLLLCLCCLPACAGAENIHIGMLIYNGPDTFMTDVFARMQALSGAETGVRATFLDGKNSQVQQNDQVEQMLKEGVDALIVNLVDRTTAVYVIRLVMQYDVPVVFINREPLAEDLATYDKAYYVGNNPKVSGLLCGEVLAEYFAGHPEVDKNGDGIIQYVMLKGEPGHQDSELRTIYSVKALRAAGYALERLGEDTAMWERAIAQEKMSSYLSTFGERIECVIANNDEMALGAIEALKAAGYFSNGKFMPVVGVDATANARAALVEGTLLGTVLNDPQGLSEAAYALAVLLARGETPGEENFPFAITREKFIWTDSRKITGTDL